MIGFCLGPAAGALATVFISATTFTLSWSGADARPPMELDYMVEGDGLVLVEARIKDRGDAMELPADAERAGGWWRLRRHERSPEARFTPLPEKAAYSICWIGQCWPVASLLAATAEGAEIVIRPCNGVGQP
jgi:hypothetical protein